MKKFVTLFAAVAALSLVSCGEATKKAEEAQDSVATAVEATTTTAVATVDSVATAAVATVDSVAAAL